MKDILKKIIISMAYYSGLNRLISARLDNKIFCVGYHSVYDERNQIEFSQGLYTNISVSVDDFEEQLLFLKRNGHTFIHFADLKKPEIQRMSKPTIVFFDDGFADVLVNAMPILKKHNIPATMFVATGLSDQTHFLWTISVRQILSLQRVNTDEIEETVREMKRLGKTERNRRISDMYARLNLALNPKDFKIFLDWREIRELSQNGFEIGSHAVSHEKLTELTDDELASELSGSKKVIEEKIGLPVDVISYPYGRYTVTMNPALSLAGYTYGVCGVAGYNDASHIALEPFGIRRIDPQPGESLSTFAVRMYMPVL